MPPSELDALRGEVRRIEDRLEMRLNRMEAASQDWRERIEAQHDNQHRDNLERFEKVEKYLNQGVGAASAVRYLWYAVVGLAGIVAGLFGHKIGN